jgi:hypothetical protein
VILRLVDSLVNQIQEWDKAAKRRTHGLPALSHGHLISNDVEFSQLFWRTLLNLGCLRSHTSYLGFSVDDETSENCNAQKQIRKIGGLEVREIQSFLK